MIWELGKAVVQSAIARRELQKITGGAANGTPWIEEAGLKLASALAIAETDPKSALTIGYDAARYAVTGLLAQQGLRPTQAGGHLVAQHVMQAQFPGRFDKYDLLRRLRNEMEYPMSPIDTIESSELEELLSQVASILEAARKLLPAMTMFTD